MRYLYIAVVMIFIVSGIAFAEEAQHCGAAAQSQGKEIITDDNDNRSDDQEFGEDNRREMPQSENYDENTGLPNVVGSDKEGEID